MFAYFVSPYKDQANGFMAEKKKSIDSLTMLSYLHGAMHCSHTNMWNLRIFYFAQWETMNSEISYAKSEHLNYASSIWLY